MLRRNPSDVQLAPSRSFDEAGDAAQEAFEGHAGGAGTGGSKTSPRSLAGVGSILQGLRLDDVHTGENRGRSTRRKGRSGQGAGKARKLPSSSPSASPTGMNSLPSASPIGGDAGEESAWGKGWMSSLGRMSQDSLHSGRSLGSKPAAATSRSKLGSSSFSSSSSRSIGRRDRPGSATGSMSRGSPDLGLNIDSTASCTSGPVDSPARAAGDSPVEQAASKGSRKGGALARVSSAVWPCTSSSPDTRADWMSPMGGQDSDGGSVLETEEVEAVLQLADLMERHSIKRSRSDFELGGQRQDAAERRREGVGMDEVAPPQMGYGDRASKRPRLVRGASHEVLPSLGQEGQSASMQGDDGCVSIGGAVHRPIIPTLHMAPPLLAGHLGGPPPKAAYDWRHQVSMPAVEGPMPMETGDEGNGKGEDGSQSAASSSAQPMGGFSGSASRMGPIVLPQSALEYSMQEGLELDEDAGGPDSVLMTDMHRMTMAAAAVTQASLHAFGITACAALAVCTPVGGKDGAGSSSANHSDRASAPTGPGAQTSSSSDRMPDEPWVQRTADALDRQGVPRSAEAFARAWVGEQGLARTLAAHESGTSAASSTSGGDVVRVPSAASYRKGRVGRYCLSERRAMLRRWMGKRKRRVWGKDQVRYKYRQVVALARAREGKGRFGNSSLGKNALMEAAGSDPEMLRKVQATIRKKGTSSGSRARSRSTSNEEATGLGRQRKMSAGSDEQAVMDLSDLEGPGPAGMGPGPGRGSGRGRGARGGSKQRRRGRGQSWTSRGGAPMEGSEDGSGEEDEPEYVPRATTTRSGRKTGRRLA